MRLQVSHHKTFTCLIMRKSLLLIITLCVLLFVTTACIPVPAENPPKNEYDTIDSTLSELRLANCYHLS